jgi:hypothetical protein
VRSLNLRKCGLTSQSGQSLAGLIRHSRALELLNINTNGLGASGVAVLAAALQPPSGLCTLHAEDCDAGADGTAALVGCASELHLGRDYSIDDIGARALAAAMGQLGGRCTLTMLSLFWTGITGAGALALVRAAMRTPRLRTLDLCYNRGITAADMPALIAACGPQPHFELRLWISSA